MTRSLLAATLLASACATDAVPLTELIVVIDSELAVPDEIDQVELAVTGPAGTTRTTGRVTLGAGNPSLPVTFGLSPQSDLLSPVVITVTAARIDTDVIVARVRTGFVERESKLVFILLRHQCRDHVDPDSCTPADCRSVEIAPTALPPWTGTIPQRDAPPVCGDGACRAYESCEDCVADCGMCDPCRLLETGGIVDESNAACCVRFGPRASDEENTEGYGGQWYWLPPSEGPEAINGARWNLWLSAAGTYRVEAYTDDRYAAQLIQSAVYQIGHAGRTDQRVVDQSATGDWTLVGDFEFAAGGGQYVLLGDVPGVPSVRNMVLFDALRLTLVRCD